MKNISNLDIEEYKSNGTWDFGNELLYRLCKDNFKHTDDGVIAAKIWLIGRSYAASIERGRNNIRDVPNSEDFYKVIVSKAFRESNIDDNLEKLKNVELTNKNLKLILNTHNDLVKTVYDITGKHHRSFSSKYLHFHRRDLFFMYDSRASSVIGRFIKTVPKKFNSLIKQDNVDEAYARYFCKCYYLKKEIETQHGTNITPRVIDNILMDEANKKLYRDIDR